MDINGLLQSLNDPVQLDMLASKFATMNPPPPPNDPLIQPPMASPASFPGPAGPALQAAPPMAAMAQAGNAAQAPGAAPPLNPFPQALGNVPQKDAFGAAALPQQEAPGTAPTTDPAEVGQRKAGWLQFFDALKNDPVKQQALLRVGTALMQPIQAGQSPLGQAGLALQGGADYLTQQRAAQAAQKLAQQKVGLEAEDVKTKRISATTDKARLPFEAEKAAAATKTSEASMVSALAAKYAAEHKQYFPPGGGSKSAQQIGGLAQALAAQHADLYANSPKLTEGVYAGIPAQAVVDAQVASKSKSMEELVAAFYSRMQSDLDTPEEDDAKMQKAVDMAIKITESLRGGVGLGIPTTPQAPPAANNDPLGIRK